jgi:hypothetical protein
MNINTASQNQGVVAFADPVGVGAAVSPAIDLRHHVNFGFTFEVLADLAADLVLKIQAAPPSDADHCLPGTFVDVPEVLTCASSWGAQGGPTSTITIPNGTKKGSICTGTLPCKPDAFIKVVPVSGPQESISVVAVLGGPK